MMIAVKGSPTMWSSTTQTTDVTFPPGVWTQRPDLNPTTTNGVESFHGHLNAEFLAPHPNIYVKLRLRSSSSATANCYLHFHWIAFIHTSTTNLTKSRQRQIRETTAVLYRLSSWYFKSEGLFATFSLGLSCSAISICANVLMNAKAYLLLSSCCAFHRAMHFSAKCGIAIACRLSVRLSVRL